MTLMEKLKILIDDVSSFLGNVAIHYFTLDYCSPNTAYLTFLFGCCQTTKGLHITELQQGKVIN